MTDYYFALALTIRRTGKRVLKEGEGGGGYLGKYPGLGARVEEGRCFDIVEEARSTVVICGGVVSFGYPF